MLPGAFVVLAAPGREYARRMALRSWLLGLSFAVLALACGGNVTVTDTAGSGAGGSSTTASSGGGGTAAICGGKQGSQCDAGAFCSYPGDSACGCCDSTGVCVTKPLDCPLDCPGACGCDGQFYCNECLANLAGVAVDPLATCAVAGAEYSLHVLPTDAPRFVLFKSDPFRDLCFQVMVVGFGGPGPFMVDVTPPWQIESILVTNHASDCELNLGGFPDPPQNQSASAKAAEGTLEIDQPDLPCGATASAKLYFDPTAPWIPDIEPFDSGYLSAGSPCDL